MNEALATRLVPDRLWALVEPQLPEFRQRRQGGGTAPTDERAVFAAVVFVLTSGCPWRMLPPTFGVTVPTAHRRFMAWSRAGSWRRLHRVVAVQHRGDETMAWAYEIVTAATRRAEIHH
ncbi:transposase [Nocardia mangyaensis]|uniref:transposase n=1 Tax=Nocardia mangyaensis TaxID=2213200 RepID=UPI003F584695